MTISEFKAWLDIFCEAVDGTPTPKQWAKIRAKATQLEYPVAIPYVSMNNGYAANALSSSQQYNMQNTTAGLISGACANSFKKTET